MITFSRPGFPKTILVSALILGLTACASHNTPNNETRGWSVERLYAEAHDELNSSNYSRAIQLYETLEARYPYGRYAQQAQMDIAYVHYKDNEPALALAAIDRFMKLYPTHTHLDYMYYLKGLIHYNDNVGTVAKILGQDQSERDPKAAKEAFQAFNTLVERFPKSIYVADSVKKMAELVNSLAENELFVARYYMKRKAYVAANSRAQQVLKEFSSSPYAEEALAIMVTAYDRMNMPQLRDDTQRILRLNYPTSSYLKKAWRPNDVPWYQFW